MKVVIFGKYKTGTTALFYKLREAMPEARTLFEPKAYSGGTGEVLAKVILSPGENDCESFLGFDRRIFLVRDPRDWLVSGTLFLLQQLPEIYRDEERCRKILSLMQQKEARPWTVDFHVLMDLVVSSAKENSLSSILSWTEKLHSWSFEFEERVAGFRFYYEDLVANRYESLSRYLGLPLKTTPPQAASAHDHVLRRGGAGDWRHWFTPRDINVFKPVLAGFIERYGYDDTWSLEERPGILPEHGTLYACRVINRRRAMKGLPAFNLDCGSWHKDNAGR